MSTSQINNLTADDQPHSIACFITPHGFGHAARAAAVLKALQKFYPIFNIDIFTKVPAWFLQESGLHSFRYNEILTDIGLVQDSAFDENLPETIVELDRFLPFDEILIHRLSGELTQRNCELVISDISPLGIAVAKHAQIPSVLIENFTWDWIYQGYPNYRSGILKHIEYLRSWFQASDYHIQTMPVCEVIPGADLMSEPVSRTVENSRSLTRTKLEIGQSQKLVLLTMGGIEGSALLQNPALGSLQDIIFIIPGAAEQYQRQQNLIKLPHHHGYYHPDLVNAADAVIGKLGYSTLAECANAGVPYGYIPRQNFPESPPLSDFVNTKMAGLKFAIGDFASPAIQNKIMALIERGRYKPATPNGANQIAQFLKNKILG